MDPTFDQINKAAELLTEAATRGEGVREFKGTTVSTGDFVLHLTELDGRREVYRITGTGHVKGHGTAGG